jgi:hypothetical protein
MGIKVNPDTRQAMNTTKNHNTGRENGIDKDMDKDIDIFDVKCTKSRISLKSPFKLAHPRWCNSEIQGYFPLKY